MNKFAIGLVLTGALTALTSPAWMPLHHNSTVAEVVPTDTVVEATPTTTEAEDAQCVKEGVELGYSCERFHEALSYASQVDADRAAGRESHGEYQARQQQREADLAYCAENRSDWSCSEGQYAGQY
jgi:hypothetical protein